MRDSNIQVDILEDGINEVFDENNKSNAFLALREIRWNENSSYKLDIRKWFTSTTGEEIPGKGVSFMSEEGPHTLTEALLKHGYGKTQNVLESIKDRDDFLPYVKETLDSLGSDLSCRITVEKAEDDEVFYDPKEILGV